MDTLLYVAIGIGTIMLLHIIGFVWSRGGVWRRNGYLTIYFTLLAVLDVVILFQLFGAAFIFLTGGVHNLEDINPIRLLVSNGLGQLIGMLGGAIFLTFALGQDLRINFRLEGIRETPLAAYLMAFPLIIAGGAFGEALSTLWQRGLRHFPSVYDFLEKSDPATGELVGKILSSGDVLTLVVALIFVAVVPAICEEALFRGFTQVNIERSGMARSRPFVAIGVASLAFASIHLSGFQLPGLLVLGLTMGFLAYRANNILLGSIAHVVNNGLIIVISFLAPQQFTDAKNTALLTKESEPILRTLMSLVSSGAFFALFLYWFYRLTEPLTARHNADHEIAYQNLNRFLELQEDPGHHHSDPAELNAPRMATPATHDATAGDADPREGSTNERSAAESL